MLKKDVETESIITKPVADTFDSKDLLIRFTSISSRFNQLSESLNILSDESNILWWITGNESHTLKLPFEELDKSYLGIVVGFELGKMVNALPGPASYRSLLTEVINRVIPNGKLRESKAWSGALKSMDESLVKQIVSKFNEVVGSKKELVKTLFPIHFSFSLELEMGIGTWKSYLKTQGDLKYIENLTHYEIAEQIYLEYLSLKSLVESGFENG